ncbi:uncharacterized protein LOC123880443 [Maniola jurtina]|uniref:uncharacterized protein LOC123880443 n=1 Tax=Maniola jurtina TaxID=191418 RepID=UPI001E68876D|nr:uncharacterized protein LOC123880443 [Maniola jurtina]
MFGSPVTRRQLRQPRCISSSTLTRELRTGQRAEPSWIELERRRVDAKSRLADAAMITAEAARMQAEALRDHAAAINKLGTYKASSAGHKRHRIVNPCKKPTSSYHQLLEMPTTITDNAYYNQIQRKVYKLNHKLKKLSENPN